MTQDGLQQGHGATSNDLNAIADLTVGHAHGKCPRRTPRLLGSEKFSAHLTMGCASRKKERKRATAELNPTTPNMHK